MSTYAKSYENTSTTVTHYSETRQTTSTSTSSGVIDLQYVRGIPGLIKLIQVIFALLAFLLVVTSPWFCVSLPGANGFFDFATMFCVVTTVILYLMLLFKLPTRVLRCKCIFWPVIELVYYIVAIIVLLIADVILSAVACTDQLKAGVAFGWFALGAYIVDLIFAIRTFLKARSSSTHHETTMATTTTATRY
jgi:FlaA1/EpsC-like NDP-sugar epimerase